jgi:hypothetical protein
MSKIYVGMAGELYPLNKYVYPLQRKKTVQFKLGYCQNDVPGEGA